MLCFHGIMPTWCHGVVAATISPHYRLRPVRHLVPDRLKDRMLRQVGPTASERHDTASKGGVSVRRLLTSCRPRRPMARCAGDLR